MYAKILKLNEKIYPYTEKMLNLKGKIGTVDDRKIYSVLIGIRINEELLYFRKVDVKLAKTKKELEG